MCREPYLRQYQVCGEHSKWPNYSGWCSKWNPDNEGICCNERKLELDYVRRVNDTGIITEWKSSSPENFPNILYTEEKPDQFYVYERRGPD